LKVRRQSIEKPSHKIQTPERDFVPEERNQIGAGSKEFVAANTCPSKEIVGVKWIQWPEVGWGHDMVGRFKA
jgi:hypothetical protein